MALRSPPYLCLILWLCLYFQSIGHALQLDQHTFGTWAAIAIHDTSSVVGAASAYGEEALTTATTLKLARALWIVPVAFISALIFSSKQKENYHPLLHCVLLRRDFS